LGDRHTSLQDAGGGTLVQLSVDVGEGLGHPGLASDRSEGSSPRSIQAMYLSRQSTSLGAGSTSMASASSALYPSRRESTNTSFEGSSSMGSAPAGFEGAPKGSVQFEGCGSRVTDGWRCPERRRSGGR
jgi:hypothetical protein